ncbi:MAG: DUF4252 domain-containing protein [Bacteroidales bacterium]|nr:DUF4252 domain-containing protein [Bacteroidales bacterium]
MKRVVLLILVIAFPAFIMAQNSAVDKLFAKYKGKQGITTVNLSPELFQMVNAMGIEELEEQDFPVDKIASVKILTIEDEEGWENVNFYEEIKNDLDVNDFAEVLTVDDSGEVVRMWMKVNQNIVSEFLLIVGGDDNVLIYITGDFNMKDLEELAEHMDHDLDIDF